MSLTVTKNTNISRILSAADADGKIKPVASLTGQVSPGKGISLSCVISDAELADMNQADLAAALDAFIADLRSLGRENGLPL